MSHQLPFPTTLPLPRPTPLRTSSGVLSRRVTEMSSRPCPPCPAAPRLTPRTLPGSGCVPVSRAKTPAPVIAPRPRAVVRLPVGGPVRVEKSRRVGCWGVGSGLGGGSGAGRGRQQVVCAEALRLRDIRMTVMAVEAVCYSSLPINRFSQVSSLLMDGVSCRSCEWSKHDVDNLPCPLLPHLRRWHSPLLLGPRPTPPQSLPFFPPPLLPPPLSPPPHLAQTRDQTTCGGSTSLGRKTRPRMWSRSI